MKHSIFFLGKTKDDFISEGIQKYSKRLRHYTNHSLTVIKEKKSAGRDEKMVAGKQLLDAVPAQALMVALDSAGIVNGLYQARSSHVDDVSKSESLKKK